MSEQTFEEMIGGIVTLHFRPIWEDSHKKFIEDVRLLHQAELNAKVREVLEHIKTIFNDAHIDGPIDEYIAALDTKEQTK